MQYIISGTMHGPVFISVRLGHAKILQFCETYGKIGGPYLSSKTCHWQLTSKSNTTVHHSSFSHQILVVLSQSQILLNNLHKIRLFQCNIQLFQQLNLFCTKLSILILGQRNLPSRPTVAK